MDFVTILIIVSIIASTLLMIVGPLMEFRGKILFLESKHAPVTKNRYGMRVMVLGTCWALLVPKIGGALNAILNVIAITDMPIFVMVVLGLFVKKINATGALSGLIAGTVGGAVVSFIGAGGIQGLAVTTATSTCLSLIVCVAVSYAVKRKPEEETEMAQFFYRIAQPEQE